jgi:hypothetical protein
VPDKYDGYAGSMHGTTRFQRCALRSARLCTARGDCKPQLILGHVKPCLINVTDARIECTVLTQFQGCASHLARQRTTRGDCKPQQNPEPCQDVPDKCHRFANRMQGTHANSGICVMTSQAAHSPRCLQTSTNPRPFKTCLVNVTVARIKCTVLTRS